jgi:hypothetical protein
LIQKFNSELEKLEKENENLKKKENTTSSSFLPSFLIILFCCIFSLFQISKNFIFMKIFLNCNSQ